MRIGLDTRPFIYAMPAGKRIPIVNLKKGEKMIKSGIVKSLSLHGKWLFTLTLFILFVSGFLIYKDKRENYTDLHSQVDNLSYRIIELEKWAEHEKN